MLQLKEIIEPLTIYHEGDDYIPIKIIFGKIPWSHYTEPNKYWRTGDFKHSLAEIKLSEKTNILRAITITLVYNITRSEHVDTKNLHLIGTGIPVFEDKTYENNYLCDEKGKLRLILDGNRAIVFFSNNEIQSKIVCNQVTFLLDKENNFCGFEVTDLTNEQVQTLDKHHQWHEQAIQNT